MLRLTVGFASLCGLACTMAMAFYVMGMGGHWSSQPAVLGFSLMMAGLFLFPFMAAIRKAGPGLLKAGVIATPLCSLPLFWFLIANARTGASRQTPAVLAVVLLGYVAISMLLCIRQLEDGAADH